MKASKFFIELDSSQAYEAQQSVSGDVYLQKKYDGRIVAVLSDGAGSGIKANVIASVISSMVINHVYSEESSLRVAKAAIETFARGDKSDDINQATFTIIDIKEDGKVKVIEFENPPTIFLRNNKIFNPPQKEEIVTLNTGKQLKINVIEFKSKVEDRIVVYSDGVIQSGFNTRRLPKGWGKEKLKDFILETLEEKPTISARSLSRKVISSAEKNDLYVVKNDTSCASVYFREPRSLMVCTGAPFDRKKDTFLAELVDTYKGEVIISGGTTSQIIARELKREVNVVMKRDPSGLPPVSTMDGATLITEGVMTLGKVRLLLETAVGTNFTGRGTDSRIVRMLLDHDVIEFYVGTSINSLHQHPDLPIELELRRNVIKDIARLLEYKFLKNVIVNYI
ncbi:MAG: SpoIIE family protein phosphatase [Rikenellaceae bacterium]